MGRAWNSGFDVLMFTVDTWQLGWRPTDINLTNHVYVPSSPHYFNSNCSRDACRYRFYYPPGQIGNENGRTDPASMRKYGEELQKDSGKWTDSCVWHGKAHTWEKVKWFIKKVYISPFPDHV